MYRSEPEKKLAIRGVWNEYLDTVKMNLTHSLTPKVLSFAGGVKRTAR